MIPHSKPTTGTEEAEAVARVLASGKLAQGAEVAAFEEECAAFAGRKHAVAVNSGTAALHLALLALGVGEGDRVALPSYACDALAQATSWRRATPVPCDIGEDYNLNPACVPSDARAVIVPHLFGATAALPKHPAIIEDLAQSWGGPAGGTAPVAIASFYATKMMTTGEGGLLLTNDEGMAKLARELRDYDNRDDFRVRHAYKMTEFQAAMGRVQLRRLPAFVAHRAKIAATYHDGLAGTPLRLPRLNDHVHFRYVVATPARESLTAWLRERGIGACRPVYRPLHLAVGGECPRAGEAHESNVSLPIYPALSPTEVEFVIQSVLQYLEQVAE